MSKPVALITGAGRGIGRAAAVELSRRGYRLVLVARTASQLEETAALCDGGGLVVPAAVNDPADVQRMVDRAMAEAGGVDVFVHAAGVAPMRPVEQLSLDTWRETIDTNLSAVFYFARLLWPQWRDRGGGAIVNVSSFAARDPFAGFSAYGAAKGGVNTLGLALAKEGQAIGVRVHTVAPAAVETEMFRKILSPEQYAADLTLDPADVARVIAQCACGDLRYTSGEVIYVRKTI